MAGGRKDGGIDGLRAVKSYHFVNSETAQECYQRLDLSSASLALEFQLRKKLKPRLKYRQKFI